MLVIDEDSTPADLQQAIVYLRQRQRQSVIASTRDEIDAEINRLLDRLADG